MMQSETSSAVSSYDRTMLSAEASRFRWRSGTRLGRLVVPLVWRTSAVAPASARSSDLSLISPWSLVCEPSGPIQRDLDQPGTGGQRLSCRGGLAWGHEQEPGAGVFEVEPELVLFISRVERAADADHRRGKECKDGFGTIRKHRCDAIARLDSVRGERGRQLIGQLAQPAIGQRGTVGDDQRGFAGRTAFEQRAEIGVDPSIVVDQRFPLTKAIASLARAGHDFREVGDSTNHSRIGFPLPASKWSPSPEATSASTRSPGSFNTSCSPYEHGEDLSADLQLAR